MGTPRCTVLAHQSEPAIASQGSDRLQCPICGGERIAFQPADEDLELPAPPPVLPALYTPLDGINDDGTKAARCNRCGQIVTEDTLTDHERFHAHEAPGWRSLGDPARSGFGVHAGATFSGTTAHSPVGAFKVDQGVGMIPHEVLRDAVNRGPGPLPQSAITGVFDETHVHSDAELRTALDAVKARDDEVPTFVDGAAASDVIIAMARARADADFKMREAVAHQWLERRLHASIRNNLEGHRGVEMGWGDVVGGIAASIAMEVFLEFLRNPPSIVEHADGTTEIREDEQ